jgi:hypothetical protein
LPISWRLGGLAALLHVAACRPVPPAKAPEPNVSVSNVSPPDGSTLAQACTPTGPELCFNAIDDNCNGVIDEGCGVRTGLLQFTIAWPGTADVNLKVRPPGGEPFPRDHDCPSDEECRGQNIENVYFDGQDLPRGHYKVEIELKDLLGADPPVVVRFGARLGSRSVGFDVRLDSAGDSKTFEFDVP